MHKPARQGFAKHSEASQTRGRQPSLLEKPPGNAGDQSWASVARSLPLARCPKHEGARACERRAANAEDQNRLGQKKTRHRKYPLSSSGHGLPAVRTQLCDECRRPYKGSLMRCEQPADRDRPTMRSSQRNRRLKRANLEQPA